MKKIAITLLLLSPIITGCSSSTSFTSLTRTQGKAARYYANAVQPEECDFYIPANEISERHATALTDYYLAYYDKNGRLTKLGRFNRNEYGKQMVLWVRYFYDSGNRRMRALYNEMTNTGMVIFYDRHYDTSGKVIATRQLDHAGKPLPQQPPPVTDKQE